MATNPKRYEFIRAVAHERAALENVINDNVEENHVAYWNCMKAAETARVDAEIEAGEPNGFIPPWARVIQQSLAEIKNDVAGVKGDIASMKGDIASMKGDIASLDAKTTAAMDRAFAIASNRHVQLPTEYNPWMVVPFVHGNLNELDLPPLTTRAAIENLNLAQLNQYQQGYGLSHSTDRDKADGIRRLIIFIGGGDLPL